MGLYTTSAKVRSLYPDLNDATKLTDTQIDFYIAQAENHISARVAQMYALPFSAVPPLLESMATEYSLIKVLDRYFTAETASKNDWRNIRKQDLDKILESVAVGETPLLTSSLATIAQRTDVGGVSSDTQTYAPTFNHLHYGEQKLDVDRQDDEESALKE